MPRKMASEVWGMSQLQDPRNYFLSSLPKATVPSLSSSFSSPLWPSFARARVSDCKLNFMHWLFKRISVIPAIFSWQRETLPLFSDGCYLGTFWARCYRLGSPPWGLGTSPTPNFSGRTLLPLKCPSGTSADACGSPASPLVPPPHCKLVTLQ